MKSENDSKSTLAQMRTELWEIHPIVSASAKLPTTAIALAISLVVSRAKRQRRSVALYADPLSGKSTCIALLVEELARQFPGAGVVIYECAEPAEDEGNFIADLLDAMEYEPPVDRNLAKRRKQLKLALYALSAQARRLFFIIDEAQGMGVTNLGWLKLYFNWLAKRSINVTVVSFGQRELKTVLEKALISARRQDLIARFFNPCLRYENILTKQELATALKPCDDGPEFPAGSGYGYTQFLWPRAFAAGLRLLDQLDRIWDAFSLSMSSAREFAGITMSHLADVLSELATITRDLDAPGFAPSDEHWKKAIRLSGFADWSPGDQ